MSTNQVSLAASDKPIEELGDSPAFDQGQLVLSKDINFARVLLTENLVAALGQDNQNHSIERYLNVLNTITIDEGDRTVIDFRRKHVVIARDRVQEGSIAVASALLHAVISLHLAGDLEPQAGREALASIPEKARKPAYDVRESMKGAGGEHFGLAASLRQAAILQMIDDVLALTEAEQSELESLKKQGDKGARSTQDRPKVAAEYALLGRYFELQRESHDNKSFTKNAWQVFAPRIDAAFQETDSSERAALLQTAVRSIINIIAKEYLIHRKNMQRTALLAQATDTQLGTLADLVALPLKEYLASRQNFGRKVSGLQQQLFRAISQLRTTSDLSPMLHTSDTLLEKLGDSVRTFDVTSYLQTAGMHRSAQGYLATSITAATALIAATPPNTPVAIPTASGVQRIGYSGAAASQSATEAASGVTIAAASQESSAPRFSQYFGPENDYPSLLSLCTGLVQQMRQRKDPDSFSASLPACLSQSFSKVCDPTDTGNPGIPEWIEHLHAVFDLDPTQAPDRKSPRQAWAAMTKNLPELQSKALRELNAIQAVSGEGSSRQITRETLSAAIFLSSVLSGLIKRHDQVVAIRSDIEKGLEALHQTTGNLVYLVTRVQLSMVNATEKVRSGEASKASAKEQGGQTATSEDKPRAANRLASLFGRRGGPNPTSAATESSPTQTLHEGLTLHDLFQRVRQNGAAFRSIFESANFELQQQRLRELLSGADNYEACQAVKRDVSLKLHPDSFKNHYPSDEILKDAANTILQSILELTELTSETASYDEDGAATQLEALMSSVKRFDDRMASLANQQRSRQEAEREAAYAALPEILAEMKILNAAVRKIQKHLEIPEDE